MGQITQSFRRVLHQQIFELPKKKNGFYHLLNELGHQQAFVSLVKVMSLEYAAMFNSNIFFVEDLMNLMMNIHVWACINELELCIYQFEHELMIDREQATNDENVLENWWKNINPIP